ncbi:MAG: hypothetical protein J5861_04135 [Desulfovibrio sp.]|nr:hypothetical protein [Desulfovibrio sp.]
MKIIYETLWWAAFLVCGIAFQTLVPKVDVLTGGVIILLQERNYKNLCWLLPACILLQEGMGTREFGAAILWYAAVIIFFKAGRWLFEAQNFLFVFLLSTCLGATSYALHWLLAPLQDIAFDTQNAVNASLLQAILLPCVWGILVTTRHWNKHVQEL